MLNKRRRDYKIDNYKKFLYSIDKNVSQNIPLKSIKNLPSLQILVDNPSNDNPFKNNKHVEKDILDNLIKTIESNFNTHKLDNRNFTGLIPSDLLFDKKKINDPNIYTQEGNTICKRVIRPDRKNTFVSPPSTFPEKKIIEINTQINDIDDLLKIINENKLEAHLVYNINMKALHKIKDPLEDLNKMIGMKDLKVSIVDQIIYFIQDLHKTKSGNNGDFMHTVIYGPPGTGKTEIAKLMGKIYSKLGILNKGTFKKVTRGDLIAGYLGQTALKTKDVIKESLGGVLFIDEAYSLGNAEKRDSFSKECIDTLCEALSDNKDNLMVIIAGYESELKECFFNYNQGLDSRFTWRFKTDEYKPDELFKIFVKKVKDIEWSIEEESINQDFFKKNMEYFKFFGRDMETLLAKTKIVHSKRVFCLPETKKRIITKEDLEKGFELYLKNDDVKNRKNSEELKKQIYSSMYC